MFFGVVIAVALSAAAAGGNMDNSGSESDAPSVTHLAPVAPDVIGVTIKTGSVTYGEQMPYLRQEGDVVLDPMHRFVQRDGKVIGSLVGAAGDILCTLDTLSGATLNVAELQTPTAYAVTSPDDPAFAGPQHPVSVYRKTKPADLAMVGSYQFDAPLEHVIYLKLPQPLTPGKRYRVQFASEALSPDAPMAPREFVYDPTRYRSEAVHVSHIGFRPDDPAKVAFLSCWLGDGGGIDYPPGLPFAVLEDERGEVVFEGTCALEEAAADDDNQHYNGANVYEMDFSALNTPGTYRVSVDGVGCSYPFVIAEDAWRSPFMVSARGLLHQRSGISLGPPYTEFTRPRPFHPEDGVKIYASTTPLMDTGNGLNRKDSNFGNLVKGKTDALVPDAWGGYMDAGDWDRRIQHLKTSMLLLELDELFPDYFGAPPLNLPESGNGLPDVINESLFGLDCYRRMQTAEGGIRGGIESEEHPRRGEGSWQESLTIMAYAPDAFSSYFYAGVAARAAARLEARASQLAATYRKSALRAMEWAEQDLPREEREYVCGKHPAVRDARNYAAAELFRLTGDRRWHDLFLATTDFREGAKRVVPFEDSLVELHSHDQRDSAWVYARTTNPHVDPQVQNHCREVLLLDADDRLASIEQTAFHWAKPTVGPFRWGALSSPEQCISVVRAHVLAGDAKYLRAAVLACQTGAGANPVNICYTTGVGHKWPQHPLNIDSRITHQPAPPGLTIGGPVDNSAETDFVFQQFGAKYVYPKVEEWPALEAHWDVFWDPLVCEYTVFKPMAGNMYVWGYLAART